MCVCVCEREREREERERERYEINAHSLEETARSRNDQNYLVKTHGKIQFQFLFTFLISKLGTAL